jgi:L-ascorbate metabolism protein UlaG (beta-lactamase superfamily)
MPDIQYIGRSCVRIRGKEGIVVCDPPPKSSGLNLGSITAHIVTLSSRNPEHVTPAVIKPVKERVFVIDGPGEYEVEGIMITGVRTYHDNQKGARHGHNTVYVISLDGLVFCHLGELGHDLTTQQIEEIGVIDVVFVPANSSLSPAKLTEIVASIEPRAVIPLYDTPKQLEKIAHEFGLKEWSAQEKVSVTDSSLPAEGEEMRMIVLHPSA